MKHVIFGTAGHIDHGKTLLTKALTGVDTDRLAEEKARGISIELGFAPMKLSEDTGVSIIDVPGHEKFVKTMMAGASGIDAALLLVAADDGVMPQTREHFDILKLLRISMGIPVITKCDLAGEARIAEVKDQIRELVKGSFLEQSEILCVSARTGEGIPELKQAMKDLLPAIVNRQADLPFRLPVDRVFRVEGFGNIATGTMTEGTLAVNDPVTLYPDRITGSVRTIQNHGKAADSSGAGTRTAVSLSSELREDIARGSVLAEPDSMLTGDWLDVYLEITEDCPYIIRNSSQLHLFHGTGEVICRLRLLEGDTLTAGQGGYAQLKTNDPIATLNGELCLLRFFSPVITVGGGVILNGASRRGKRNHAPLLSRLRKYHSEDRKESLLQHFEDGDLTPVSAEHLRKVCNLSQEFFSRTVREWTESEVLAELQPGAYCSCSALMRGSETMRDLLAAYHEKYPLQPGMPTAELKHRLFTKESEAAFSWMEKKGFVVTEEQFSHLPDFTPVFTKEHKIMQRKLLHYYKDAGFLVPGRRETDRKFEHRQPYYSQVLANMLLNRQLILLSSQYIAHPEQDKKAREIFLSLFETGDKVTLADFRDAAGISRKYAQLFLEYWDRQGICRRAGDARVLTGSPAQES